MKLQPLYEEDLWSRVRRFDIEKEDIHVLHLSHVLNNLTNGDRRFILKLEQEESEQEYLKNLANSIRVNGMKQSIKVEKHGDKYHVPDGNHRLVAAKRLGLKTVPVKFV